MASKCQKFKSYSPEFKEMILKEYFSGQGSERALANKYNIPNTTVSNWIIKTNSNIDVSVDNRGKHGRPKTKGLTLEDYKERYEILKKYQAFLQARREKR